MQQHAEAHGSASPFKQPKAVFAVAFACVVSFMGIGLVDPILPAISNQLHASPSQVTLLFTSYLVVTAVAMLITNWVSSRLGAKRTLITGLALIVVTSACSETGSYRAGVVVRRHLISPSCSCPVGVSPAAAATAAEAW